MSEAPSGAQTKASSYCLGLILRIKESNHNVQREEKSAMVLWTQNDFFRIRILLFSWFLAFKVNIFLTKRNLYLSIFVEKIINFVSYTSNSVRIRRCSDPEWFFSDPQPDPACWSGSAVVSKCGCGSSILGQCGSETGSRSGSRRAKMQCCGSGMFIPDPGSRIPDPKTATKERGEKKILSYFFM